MADEFHLPNRPPPSSRQPKTGERLFEFLRDHDRILCELYDLGGYCIDVRFSINEDFWYSRSPTGSRVPWATGWGPTVDRTVQLQRAQRRFV